ncbi:MAG: ABC transporter substrate-binding protein [Chloroflexi bacterium]|nr:ABC transporter substrate-binding protein [Chloroflexota bacterium]
MNRWLIVLVLGIVIALAACAPAPAPTAVPAPPAAPTTAPAATVAAPTAAPLPTVAPPATTAPLKGELSLLCTPQEIWCAGMKKEFEAKYPGVTVNYVRLSSGEGLTRIRNEKVNPTFDIWWGGPADSFIAAKKEGLLETYKSPNSANILDQKLMKDADDTWTGIYVGSLGFATNTDYLKKNPTLKAPTSWDELVAPALKGQVVIAHPASSGTSYTALCTVLQIRGEDKGWEYMKAFNANVFQYTKSGAAPATLAGQGEAAVGIVFSHDIVAAQEKKLPLQLTFPAEGTGYEIGAQAIVKNAKNLALAKAWYDWALEPTTQELGPKYTAYQAPTVKGAKASKPELLQVKLINYNFDYCGDKKKAFVDKFSNELTSADKAK